LPRYDVISGQLAAADLKAAIERNKMFA